MRVNVQGKGSYDIEVGGDQSLRVREVAADAKDLNVLFCAASRGDTGSQYCIAMTNGKYLNLDLKPNSDSIELCYIRGILARPGHQTSTFAFFYRRHYYKIQNGALADYCEGKLGVCISESPVSDVILIETEEGIENVQVTKGVKLALISPENVMKALLLGATQREFLLPIVISRGVGKLGLAIDSGSEKAIAKAYNIGFPIFLACVIIATSLTVFAIPYAQKAQLLAQYSQMSSSSTGSDVIDYTEQVTPLLQYLSHHRRENRMEKLDSITKQLNQFQLEPLSITLGQDSMTVFVRTQTFANASRFVSEVEKDETVSASQIAKEGVYYAFSVNIQY